MNESHISIAHRFSDWYAASSRSSRICLVVILILLVLVLIQVWSFQSKTSMCDLLGECPLRANELQRIQIALGQAGLDQYTVNEHSILVPSEKRSVYLQAITEGDALPESLCSTKSEFPSLSPFLSRSQQALMERTEKKRQIRNLVARLPFVDQAWFEMDESKSRSAFEPTRLTAVVSIQPTGATQLQPAEIATVRQVVSGALAGIDSQNIVVTDLNAGRAFRQSDQKTVGETEVCQQAGHERSDQNRRSFYENEIRRLLGSYANVEIDVHYYAPTKYESESNRFAAKPILPSGARSSSSISPMTVGTNSQASVEDFDNRGKDTFSKPSVTLSQIKIASSTFTRTAERVAVVISVPQGTVEELFAKANEKTVFGWPRQQKSEHLLESNFEKIKSEIIEKIRPLLPVASFDKSDPYPISVLLERNHVAQASHWTSDLPEILNQHWPTVAVLLVGLMMMLVVTRSNNAQQPRRDHTLSIDSAAIQSPEEQQQRSDAENKLSQLIEQDPDAAAEVIKSWIRKAA